MLGTPKGCVWLHRRQLLRNNTPRITTAQPITLLVVMDAYGPGALSKRFAVLSAIKKTTKNYRNALCKVKSTLVQYDWIAVKQRSTAS